MKNNDRKIRPSVLLLCGLVLLGITAAFWLGPKMLSDGPAAQSQLATPGAHPSERPAVTAPPVRLPPGGKPPQEWGIEVVGLFPAMGGRVLDLRYRIVDVAKAAPLPNQPGGIYLMDEATGITTKSPNSTRTGSIPQNPQKLQAGRTYSLGFPNPEGRLKSGTQVTVVIGGLRAEHLAVQ